MPQEEKTFHIMWRKPKYPLIVISKDHLMSAFDIDELAWCCVNAELTDGETKIKAIDSDGQEFWYYPDKYVIFPASMSRRWSKKSMIDLYNNTESNKTKYSEKSLSAKKVYRIVLDICNLLKS